MNLKYLSISIVILFAIIVFLIPLSKEDSKSKQFVNKVAKSTTTFEKEDKDQFSIKLENRNFKDLVVIPHKTNSLKKSNLANRKDEIKTKIEVTLAKIESSKNSISNK